MRVEVSVAICIIIWCVARGFQADHLLEAEMLIVVFCIQSVDRDLCCIFQLIRAQLYDHFTTKSFETDVEDLVQ